MAASGAAWAQTDSLSTKELMDMSLEELMDIQVVSASKKAESLFDAPLSASVLTRDEIQKAGATSIMEALRLMPGLIVRQETNGNYDIHIRGLDNVPPNTSQIYATNTTTLVMIDNRPVYSYLHGGTFWESLPVDLNDVEKIEVIRGASSTLYGPNAVSGVINIITRKTDKKGLSTRANGQYGSLNTAIANASVGYQFSDKLSAIVSGNYQGRGRDVSYYHPVKDRFFTTADSLDYQREKQKSSSHFPHPDRSMDKYGANLFLDFKANDQVRFSLTSGIQNSEVQNAFSPVSLTSLAVATSRTVYTDLKASLYGLSGQVSYLQGKQDPNLGTSGSTYDFSNLDAFLEYDIKLRSNLSVKPGVSYRRAVYDDTPYWDASKYEGSLNTRTQLDTYSGSLRVDYKAFGDKFRLVGGARIDKFTYPAKSFLSYQLAASYKSSERHLLRAVYSRAYRSPSIFDTYLHVELQSAPPKGLPPGSYQQLKVLGNRNLDMLQSDMLELGYRGKLADNLSVDVEAYYTQTKNYTNVVVTGTTLQYGQKPSDPIVVNTEIRVQNIPISVDQLGATLSFNYVLKRLQVKPFVTLQTSRLHFTQVDSTHRHEFTPAVYGGAFINYQLSQKLNVNLSPYYYSAQTYYQSANNTYHDGLRGVEHLAPKLLLNATMTYSPVKAVSLFVTVKNLLNNNAREYYRTDQIGMMLLVGASLRY
jgi:iron complex outermembrane receptor protein